MSTQSTVNPDVIGTQTRRTSIEDLPVRETYPEGASEEKTRLRQAFENSQTKVTEWKGAAEKTIREKPIQSVLIAAGVGAVVGLLVGRRRH
jgi:ElaB/YqjD/DUF883 family membrane-anchored ribosome-binding protein